MKIQKLCRAGVLLLAPLVLSACAERVEVYDVVYRDVTRPAGKSRTETDMKGDEAGCRFTINTRAGFTHEEVLWDCMRSKGWAREDTKRRFVKQGYGL